MTKQGAIVNTTHEEKLTMGNNPLSDEDFIHALRNTHWVTRMACGLEMVTMATDINEAHAIAREHLGDLVDPVDGLRLGIHPGLHLRWRIAAREPHSRILE
jgi:uncharacterized protein (DUF2461 family)